MDKINYIVTFTACLSLRDEQKILYFTDEENALTVYEGIRNAEGIVDCYLSKVVRPSHVETDKKPKELPSCNNCTHNGEQASTGNCIKCSCFDRYERSIDKGGINT